MKVYGGFAWDSEEADKARLIRTKVFQEEQKVPADEEFDDIDLTAWHVLVTEDSGAPLGTGRLFEFEGGGRIGRMAVSAEARGLGVGRRVIELLLAEGRRRGWRRFVLDAQVRAIGFYERCGFTVIGEEHLDAGIPHRMMERVEPC